TVVARTNPAPRSKEMSVFLVEPKFKGFRIGTVYDTMGCKGHPIAELLFEDCEVPEENRLGPEGKGWLAATKTLMEGRPVVAARCIGACERLLEISTDYAKTRKQFGQAIGEFQGIHFMLADMATLLDAATLLTYRAAWLRDQGQRVTREAAMAKMNATESAQTIIDMAVQMHGGMGVKKGNIVESLYREIRALRIYEGATEVQQLIIGRDLIKG
ncbi:MAG: acyl-CoA dehydrogenase, partial [Betaproteobacteria bacterium]|nr:acyl-CoA dehydrogenase [Betaproteobacteria bacterium]